LLHAVKETAIIGSINVAFMKLHFGLRHKGNK